MKMFKNAMTVLVPIAAVALMTACGGGNGGGTVTTPLATGGFVKYVGDSSTLVGIGLIDTGPTTRWQHMYTPADVKGSGYIQSISLMAVDARASDITCPDLSIKMGHTSLAELTNTFADNVENGKGSLISVRTTGEVVFTAGEAGEMYTIALDEPFVYNGVDNLVVEFERVAACSGSFTEGGTYVTPVSATWTRTDGSPTGSTGIFFTDLVFDFSGGVDKLEKTGTSNNYWPFTNESAHTQNLYTAADINGSGPITGLAFQMNAPSTEQTFTVSVKLGHTTLTDLTGTFADNSSDLTAVAADINFTVPAGLVAGDWFWVPLNGSFKYNGIDNLLVDIEVPVGTGNIDLRYTASANVVRVAGNVGDVTTSDLGGTEYHAKFRFNGGTMDVIDPSAGAGDSMPFNTNVSGSQLQYLYRATDLGTSGKITSVYLRLKNDSVEGSYPEFSVNMGHTDLYELTATYADNMNDAKTVYSNTYTIPVGLKAGDWVEIPLSTPFTYNGTDNLVIHFIEGQGTGSNTIKTTSTIPLRRVYGLDKNAITADGISGYFADIRLQINK